MLLEQELAILVCRTSSRVASRLIRRVQHSTQPDPEKRLLFRRRRRALGQPTTPFAEQNLLSDEKG
jgi:hypothetical protein